MASFAELLGERSISGLEGAGYDVHTPAEPESYDAQDDAPVGERESHYAPHDSATGASVSAVDTAVPEWEEELLSVPAPGAYSRAVPHGVRPQEWSVFHGYASRGQTQGVFDNARRNDIGYAAIAENNCRRYCEGGENWYRLTQLALAGDLSPLVERGYLTQADADSREPLEAAARAFANAHYTLDLEDKYVLDRLGGDAPTWEKLRFAYLIVCAPAGGWKLAAPSDAVACIAYRVQRTSSFKTIANKRFRDSTEAQVSWMCERLNATTGVEGVVAQRLLYRMVVSVELDWWAGGGVSGRVETPAGGFTVSTRSDILGVSQAAFSLCQIMSAATERGGYTGGKPGAWKVLEFQPSVNLSQYDEGADGEKADVFGVHSVGEATDAAAARFSERTLSVFAPEIVNEDGDYVMLYHKPFELVDGCLPVNARG